MLTAIGIQGFKSDHSQIVIATSQQNLWIILSRMKSLSRSVLKRRPFSDDLNLRNLSRGWRRPQKALEPVISAESVAGPGGSDSGSQPPQKAL